MTVLTLSIAAAVLLVACWIRAAGTAITRVPRADALRDSSDGVTGAEVVAELLDERDAISPAVGVVVSALLIIGSVLATAVLGADETVNTAILWAIGVGLVAFLIGDLVPRRLGRLNPRRWAYASAGLLLASVRLGGWANDLLPDAEDNDAESGFPVDEVEDQEKVLIDSVLEFSETIVREVMTPRPDMITIPVTAPMDDLIDIASNEGFSRVPVMSNGDVVGIVMVKDLLPMLRDGQRPSSIAEVMRPVEFVPEIKHASALLSEMQDSHIHQVIVVDEFGDVTGLVTIEDLLEELVGEIADETDLEEALISQTGEGWRVDARLSVDELEKATGIELPDEDWDTVGGLILGLAERIPEEGEVFSIDTLVLDVVRMQGRRIAEVYVSRSDRIGAE
jgi:CBS domain containing-hemolysin-like protein